MIPFFYNIDDLTFDDRDPLDTFDHGLNHDYVSHLRAIRGLLSRQDLAAVQLEVKIEESEQVAKNSRGEANEYAVARHTELLQGAIYQDAAHSMAAVGMLAPLIESIFLGVFENFGRKKPQGQLVNEIVDLINDESLGIREFMPNDLESTLEALFLYRNKMFHQGFEWTLTQRQAFAERLSEWASGWFDHSTSGGEPWIFYMSPEFISHCINTTEDVLRGLIRYQHGRCGKLWMKQENIDS